MRHAGYQVGVAFEVFVTRSRVKYDCGFARLNPPGLSEFLEGNATSRPLRSDEQTLGSTYGSGRRQVAFWMAITDRARLAPAPFPSGRQKRARSVREASPDLLLFRRLACQLPSPEPGRLALLLLPRRG